MTPEKQIALPLVPSSVSDAHGHPRFGTYRGELDEVDLLQLRGPYSLPSPLRWLKHKKWTYAKVVTPEVLAVFAVLDLTYTSNAFISVVDLATHRVVYDQSFLGLPGTKVHVNGRPGRGTDAFFQRPDARFSVRRQNHRYDVDIDLRGIPLLRRALSWQGTLSTDGAAEALTVISPVREDGLVNVTQKRAGLDADGVLRVGERRYELGGGTGGIDYTHGLLARHTAWRWAMGNGRLPDGTPFGFNLVEGINDHSDRCNENALWIGRELHPLGRARFDYRKDDPAAPWSVETVDGSVTLRFHPLHLHRERRDYKVVRSNFVQPLGLFSGTVQVGARTLEVKDVGGVTEDQDILW